MVGARLRYAIVDPPKDMPGFHLNPIFGIGGGKDCGSPFESGSEFFSFHAVTTTAFTTSDVTGARINDATLALDGDDDPTKQPCTKKLVQNVASTEYLWRLSDKKPEYTYVDDKPTRVH